MRIEQSDLILDKSKCDFGLGEVKFVGLVFSVYGVRDDPSKTEDIFNMLILEQASAVHRFLGMITYQAI